MSKPRLLDLFCCGGGASNGYYQSGFEVIGVDIVDHSESFSKAAPDGTFIQSDWESALHMLGGTVEAIHASPPCQRWSTMTKRWQGATDEHPDLIGYVRESLLAFDIPFVIENVPGAPLENKTLLCGSHFDLHSGDYHLRRHRYFEVHGFDLPQPARCDHKGKALGVYGNTGGSSKRDGLVFAQLSDWRVGMGMPWAKKTELQEAIPPAYTKYVGGIIQDAIR